MATLKTFFLVLFFLSLQNSPSSALKCKQPSCDKSGQIVIRFPFRVNKTDLPQRCGYPKFDLACTEDGQNQTIVKIADMGEFLVTDVIDYWEPSIKIGDPQNCMANRWLNYNSTLGFAPFEVSPLEYNGFANYTFLNCTKNTSSLNLPNNTPIPCLSGDGHTVTALLTDDLHLIGAVTCSVISKTVWAPKPKFDPVFPDRVTLTWTEPDCRQCEVNGGSCGSGSGPDLACTYPSRIVQHLIAAAIILCFVSCFLALVFHVCIMGRSERGHLWTVPNLGVEVGAGSGRAGLDKVVVDSYPEMVFGENKDSGSGPEDNTCSICISEYQQGEVLKTIPSCNHYFHGACIDKWLLKNATCPLCRILTHE